VHHFRGERKSRPHTKKEGEKKREKNSKAGFRTLEKTLLWPNRLLREWEKRKLELEIRNGNVDRTRTSTQGKFPLFSAPLHK